MHRGHHIIVLPSRWINRARTRAALCAAICVAVAGLALGAREASGSEPDALIAAMQAKLDRLDSLKGSFVQSLDSPGLGRPRSERGRFYMRKPSRMRWDYEAPERKMALIDGRRSWLYLPDEQEAYRGEVRTLEQRGAAALLLSGRVRLDRHFVSRRLSPEEAGPQGVADAVAVELKPRKPSEEFDRLILAIDPTRLQIRRLTAVDANGGRMVFDLFEIEEDPALPDDLFDFEPPAGVVVLEAP